MGELISACKSTFQRFGYFWNLWFFQVWKQLGFLPVFNLRFFQVFLRLITVILSGCNLKKTLVWTFDAQLILSYCIKLKKSRVEPEKILLEPEKISGFEFWCSAHSQLLPQTEKISGWTWENIRFWIFLLIFLIVLSWEEDDKLSVAV